MASLNNPTTMTEVGSITKRLPDETFYECLCGKSYRELINFHMHRIKATCKPAKETVVCRVCNKMFSSLKHYKGHLRSLHEIKPFACDTCGRRFRHHLNLHKHRMIHTDEKPFTCGKCDSSFTLKENLSRHVNMAHNIVREFPCGVCGKSYKLKQNLDKHQLTHTTGWYYKCENCANCYLQLEALNKHAKKCPNNNEMAQQ